MARRRAPCHVCERRARASGRVPDDTPQRYLGADRHPGRPDVDLYACDDCDTVLMSFADVYDGEGLLLAFSRSWWVGGAEPDDPDEWMAKLRAWLVTAYARWDPSKSVRFRAYAFTFLRNRATDDVRSTRGRVVDGELQPRHVVELGGERVPVEVESLDALRESRGTDSLGRADRGGRGDPARDRSPDLTRLLDG